MRRRERPYLVHLARKRRYMRLGVLALIAAGLLVSILAAVKWERRYAVMAAPQRPGNDDGTAPTARQGAGEPELSAEDSYADAGQATARDGLALLPTKFLRLLHLV